MTEVSCLYCKHHTHYYNPPSMGEGELELEFYCEHELVPEFEVEDESELENIAGNCDYFEDNTTAEIMYLMAINDDRICKLCVKIKREYNLENHTLSSIFSAFHLIAKLAVNYYSQENRDQQWCQQIINNQELMNQLANKLKHYFLEVYQ